MDNRLFDSLNFFVRLTGVADKFISDVRATAAKCLADPEACDKGSAAIYGMAQAIPDRSIVDQITWYLFINILILIHPSILFFRLFFLFSLYLPSIPPLCIIFCTFFLYVHLYPAPPFSFIFFLCLFLSLSVPLSFRLCRSISVVLTFSTCLPVFLTISVSLFYLPKSFRIFIRILLSSTCTRTP